MSTQLSQERTEIPDGLTSHVPKADHAQEPATAERKPRLELHASSAKTAMRLKAIRRFRKKAL